MATQTETGLLDLLSQIGGRGAIDPLGTELAGRLLDEASVPQSDEDDLLRAAMESDGGQYKSGEGETNTWNWYSPQVNKEENEYIKGLNTDIQGANDRYAQEMSDLTDWHKRQTIGLANRASEHVDGPLRPANIGNYEDAQQYLKEAQSKPWFYGEGKSRMQLGRSGEASPPVFDPSKRDNYIPVQQPKFLEYRRSHSKNAYRSSGSGGGDKDKVYKGKRKVLQNKQGVEGSYFTFNANAGSSGQSDYYTSLMNLGGPGTIKSAVVKKNALEVFDKPVADAFMIASTPSKPTNNNNGVFYINSKNFNYNNLYGNGEVTTMPQWMVDTYRYDKSNKDYNVNAPQYFGANMYSRATQSLMSNFAIQRPAQQREGGEQLESRVVVFPGANLTQSQRNEAAKLAQYFKIETNLKLRDANGQSQPMTKKIVPDLKKLMTVGKDEEGNDTVKWDDRKVGELAGYFETINHNFYKKNNSVFKKGGSYLGHGTYSTSDGNNNSFKPGTGARLASSNVNSNIIVRKFLDFYQNDYLDNGMELLKKMVDEFKAENGIR